MSSLGEHGWGTSEMVPWAHFSFLQQFNLEGVSMLRYRMIAAFGLMVLVIGETRAGIVASGDSLVDRQNFFLSSGMTFPDPGLYADGRFSNGPLWVEDWAGRMGLSVPTASLAGGTNLAFNAARITGVSPGAYAGVPNVETQIAGYLLATGNVASYQDHFAFWAGANDFFFGQTDPSIPVASLSGSITSLHAAGARKFVVLNLPALGQTPFFRGTPNEAALDGAAVAFNTILATEMENLRNTLTNVKIYEVDIFSLFQDIQADPGAFGLTNAVDSSTNYDPVTGIGTSLAVANPDEYLFWDSVHPTAAAHLLISKEVYRVVPEPDGAAVAAIAGAAAVIYGWFVRRSCPYKLRR